MYRPSQARVLLDGSETRNKKLTAVSQHLLGKHNQLKAGPATAAATASTTGLATSAATEVTTAAAAPMLGAAVAAASGTTVPAADIPPFSASGVAVAEEVEGRCLASSATAATAAAAPATTATAIVAAAPDNVPTTMAAPGSAAAAVLAPKWLSAPSAAEGATMTAVAATASTLLVPGVTADTSRSGAEADAADDLCGLCTSPSGGDNVAGSPTPTRDGGETRAGLLIGVPEETDSVAGATTLGGGVAGP